MQFYVIIMATFSIKLFFPFILLFSPLPANRPILKMTTMAYLMTAIMIVSTTIMILLQLIIQLMNNMVYIIK